MQCAIALEAQLIQEKVLNCIFGDSVCFFSIGNKQFLKSSGAILRNSSANPQPSAISTTAPNSGYYTSAKPFAPRNVSGVLLPNGLEHTFLYQLPCVSGRCKLRRASSAQVLCASMLRKFALCKLLCARCSVHVTLRKCSAQGDLCKLRCGSVL